MKKLIFLFLLISLVNINADIRIDRKTGKHYSTPTSPNIDQKEYDELVRECQLIYRNARLAGWTPQEGDAAIFGYLRMVGTPTAMRLIDDLKKLVRNAMYQRP